MNLQSSIVELKGIGAKSAEKFYKIFIPLKIYCCTILFDMKILRVRVFQSLLMGKKLSLRERL